MAASLQHPNIVPVMFPESELVDWVITHPDGIEEGNVVGKFLDEWQKTHP